MKKRGQSEVISGITIVILGIVSIIVIFGIVSSILNDTSRNIDEENLFEYECSGDEDCSDFEICENNRCLVLSETGCYEDFSCSEWSECFATFGIKEILEKNTTLIGVKERKCISSRGCLNDQTQILTCDYKINVYANKTFWCYENYVDVYNSQTNELVSRIKETEISTRINISRIDIDFPFLSQKETCDFCFNYVKDFDETGVDCGGNYCSPCIDKYAYFDWLFILIVGLWFMLGILIISLIILRRTKVKT